MFRMKLFKPSNIICISVIVISTFFSSFIQLDHFWCEISFDYGSQPSIDHVVATVDIPIPRNPEVTFAIVIPLLHASANNVENWNFVTTCPGWSNKYW